MKNDAIPPNGSDALPVAWTSALQLLDQDLRRRGAAGGTRRLYTTDVEELGRWAARYDLAPEEIDYPWLRRYAAQLAERGLAPRTVARKLAGLRACFRVLVEHGLMESNPAELLASPKLPQRLPRALKPADVSALLDRIPASTPLEQRDRALFELAYACGLRAEELVDLDVGSIDFDAEQVRVEGKGGKTRIVPAGEHALPAHLGPQRRGAGRRPSARVAPLVRHSSSGGRCRSKGHPGIARARVHIDHSGLHSGRVSAPTGCVRTQPSPGVNGKGVTLETNVKAIELKDLWRKYKSTGSDRAREQLVVAYSPLVKYVAGRMSSGLPAHVEESDLISYGLIGLINAIERFDPEREIKFETYAITRIKGAIIDELRALDWVPRSVRARAREIERVHGKLEHRLHRTPTDEEMARELQLSVEEFQESLVKISNSTVVALDELWAVSDSSGDQVSLLDTLHDPDAPDPQQILDASELKDRLADAISALPEREKLVNALYYYENLTLREIGEVLGVTESRISQLHTKAVLRLKSRLQGDNLR